MKFIDIFNMPFFYQESTGNFYRVNKSRRFKPGELCGWLKSGYRIIHVKGENIRAHHLVWFIHNGEFPKLDIDHINGNRSDNRISNLREVSRKINSQNMKKCHKDNKSGYLGVTKQPKHNSWFSRITINGKNIHLGSFNSPELAYKAYLEAKIKIHKGYSE